MFISLFLQKYTYNEINNKINNISIYLIIFKGITYLNPHIFVKYYEL